MPQPELNPLLNPVLSQNMGRWAEVYFTSPPEKRDEAVLQLIRELGGEDPKSGANSAVAVNPERSGSADSAESNSPTFSTDSSKMQGTTCFWCGYINSRDYKFCGRCGESLATPLPYSRRGAAEEVYTESNVERGAQPDEIDLRRHEEPRILPSLESSIKTSQFTRHGVDFDISPLISEPPARSFRPWIAVIMAIIVVAVAYVVWHGSSSRGGSSQAGSLQAGLSQAGLSQGESSREVSSSQGSTTATEGSAKDQAAAQPVTSAPPAVSPSTARTVNSEKPGSTATGAVNAAPSVATTPSTTSAATEIGAPASGKGWAELAQARDFLDGKNGKQRNTAEAAEWLWRSVRQQNVEATVLLADLYLHGDGIEKNCDQARLLLDAAAIKGRKDAAEQLQNLPAFGCQ